MDFSRDYALTKQIPQTFGDAVAKVRDALAVEGFGVLTEIDVQATMKKKLDIDRRPYVILGACNPALAHQALTAEMPVGVLLPCNVTVFEDDEGKTWVQAIRPEAMFSVVGRDDMAPIVEEVEARLNRVLAAL